MAIDDKDDAEKRATCTREAVEAGSWAAAKTIAVSGPAVLAAVRFWPAFRKATNTSSRMGLAWSPFVGAFFIASEFAMTDCVRRDQQLRRVLKASQ